MGLVLTFWEGLGCEIDWNVNWAEWNAGMV